MSNDSLIIVVDEKELVVEILSEPHYLPHNPSKSPLRRLPSQFASSTPPAPPLNSSKHRIASSPRLFVSSSPEKVLDTYSSQDKTKNTLCDTPSRSNNIIKTTKPLVPVPYTVSNTDILTQSDKISFDNNAHIPNLTPINSESSPHTPKAKLLEFSNWFSSEASDPICDPSSSPFKAPKRRKTTLKASNSTSLSKSSKSSKSAVSTKEMNLANKSNRLKEELIAELYVEIPEFLTTLCDDRLQKRFVARSTPTVTWTRKVSADFDPESGIFIPCEAREEYETTMLIHLSANQFMEHVSDRTLIDFIRECSKETPITTPRILLLVEGYDKERARIKAAHDREFQKEIRKAMGETVRQSAKQILDIPSIESQINELQISHRFNIFYTKGTDDSANWMYSFTYSISNSRYARTSIHVGVKLGTDTKLTYLAALQQFRFITNTRAEQILSYFPNLQLIYEILHDKGTLGKCDDNSNLIPPSTDQVFRKFFLSDDPEEVLE